MQNPQTVYSSTSLNALCGSYLLAYYTQIGLSVAIALSIILIKSILKIFITFLAKFQRYESFGQQASSLIVNLFVTYTFTTFVITFLLQANILTISFKSIIKGFISNADLLNNVSLLVEYEDLSRSWYLDIGYKILMNWLTFTLLPHIIQPVVLLVSERISECQARSQKFQRNMDRML